LAAAFALPFAIAALFILEILPDDSWPRRGIWRIKNTLSTRSAARLRRRIEQAEAYASMYADDKADKRFYLTLLRVVIGMLTLIALGAASTAIEHLWLDTYSLPIRFIGPPGLRAALCYVVAVLMGMSWLVPLTAFDNRAKLSRLVGKLNRGIAALKKKLEAKEAAEDVEKRA